MENQAEQAPIEQPVQIQQEIKPKTNYKMIATIVSIVALVLVGAVLFPAKFIDKNQQTSITNTIPPTDPTANWKTYTNTNFGFSIKYNPAFAPEILGNAQQNSALIGFGSMKNNGFEIDITPIGTIDYYKNQIVDHTLGRIDKEEEILVDGITATKLTYKQVIVIEKFDVSQVIINNNGRDYIITALSSDIDQILPTFKFTDQVAPTGTTDTTKLDYTVVPPNDWESNNLCGVDHKRSPQMPYSGRDAYTNPYNYECDFGYNFDELVGTIIPQILTIKVFSNYDGGSRRQFFAKYYDYSKNRTLVETMEFTAGNNSWLKLKWKDTNLEDDRVNDAVIYLTAKGSTLVAVIGENDVGLTEIDGTVEPVKMFLTSINF